MEEATPGRDTASTQLVWKMARPFLYLSHPPSLFLKLNYMLIFKLIIRLDRSTVKIIFEPKIMGKKSSPKKNAKHLIFIVFLVLYI